MLTQILAGIGAATLLYISYRAYATFGYYLKPSKLNKCLRGPDTWALVIGASDGIGRAFAEELAHRGFNVVLHGRNSTKLDGCVRQLRTKFPDRKFDIPVADASLAGDPAIKQIGELVAKLPSNLTVLVNNVGAGSGDRLYSCFVDRSLPEVSDIMTANEGFPTLLTQALLPQLIEHQPALAMNIRSALDDFSGAYVETYCGSKAHNKSFNQSLRTEFALEGIDIERLHIRILSVATPSSQMNLSAMTVTPRNMARGALHRVGSGVASTAGCF